MGLNFVVTGGVRAGDQFRILDGLTIGRSRADISLRDPKVSGVHARIASNESGTLILVDETSSNGIWVDGEHVERVELRAGLEVKIGDSILKVLDDHELDASEEERNSWQGQLSRYLRQLTSPQGKGEVTSYVFPNAVELSILRGPQAGTTWVLGYGPRDIGASTNDLFLQDSTAPDVCFSLHAKGDRIRIETNYPDRVLLNDKPIISEVLHDGDRIKVGQNEINVRLLD